MLTSPLVVWVLGLVLLFWALGAYNRLTRLKTRIGNTFVLLAQQLQARDSVVERLSAVCLVHDSTHARAHEALQAAVAQARVAREAVRAQPHDSEAVLALAAAQRVVAVSVQRLTALSETNAALHADENFHQLCDDLNTTAGAVSLARQAYNSAVAQYNRGVGQFPALVLAKLFGLQRGAELPATEPTLLRRTAPVPLE